MTPPVMSMTNTVTGMVSFGATILTPVSNTPLGSGASYTAKTWDAALTAATATVPGIVVADPSGEQGGYATLTFQGLTPVLPFKLWHILNFAAVSGTANYSYISDTVRAWADAYYAALGLLPFFTATTAPSVSYPPKVTHEYAQFKWQNKVYHAVLFRHDLRNLL